MFAAKQQPGRGPVEMHVVPVEHFKVHQRQRGDVWNESDLRRLLMKDRMVCWQRRRRRYQTHSRRLQGRQRTVDHW